MIQVNFDTYVYNKRESLGLFVVDKGLQLHYYLIRLTVANLEKKLGQSSYIIIVKLSIDYLMTGLYTKSYFLLKQRLCFSLFYLHD